jgi:hypothetical protein
MRLSPVIVLGLVTSIVCGDRPAMAQPNYPWCADYDLGVAGFRSCRFWTLEQCVSDVRGIGGSCGPSPYASAPEPRPPTRIAKRDHHDHRPRSGAQ